MQGAVVAPSDEDAQTFTISGANGEEYKLRAGDSKERQLWVVRLRREIEDATNIIRASKEVRKRDEEEGGEGYGGYGGYGRNLRGR